MRCSPWLPKARSSRPCSRSSTSSRCGPAEVVSRSRSRDAALAPAPRAAPRPSTATCCGSAGSRRRRGRRAAPSRSRNSGSARSQKRCRACATDGPGLGELLVPRVEVAREGPPGADPPQQRHPLLERGGVGAAGARVGRPEAGDRAIHVGAAQGRRALHDVEALGQEDDAREALGEGVGAAHGRAVDGDALRLARGDGHARRRRAAALLALELDAQEGRRRRGCSGRRSRCAATCRRGRRAGPPAGSSCPRRSGRRRASCRGRGRSPAPRSSGRRRPGDGRRAARRRRLGQPDRHEQVPEVVAAALEQRRAAAARSGAARARPRRRPRCRRAGSPG